MKRIVIIEILLLAATIASTYVGIELLSSNSFNTANRVPIEIKPDMLSGAYKYLRFGLFSLFASLATLAVMIVIAIKDFPVFKPLTDKLADKRAARKEARSQAKAEQAAIAKQERIDQLKAELDELQKDE